jgi:uncharacterized membrane protein YraQ (UPF0718 family)
VHENSSQITTTSSCCDTDSDKFDYFFWIPFSTVAAFYLLHLFGTDSYWFVHHLGMGVFELMNTMALGVLIGVIMVGILSYIPRELVTKAMGTDTGLKGILRATAAGVLLDLCSHGILMVGAKLYERGVSTGQVMAFLIASPWNSLSLTIILVALIGLQWTLLFIALSMLIAVVSGVIFDRLVASAVLPNNPNKAPLPDDFKFWPALKQTTQQLDFSLNNTLTFITTALRESKIVIRWLLIGVLIAAAIRTFVPEDYFADYFGPSLLGLGLTILAATIIEVCSEGSTPIAADIFNRAGAPGNSFSFLMAGVSTDYTEIMVLKERTKSWKLALFLPLVTLPQIIILAIILNLAA